MRKALNGLVVVAVLNWSAFAFAQGVDDETVNVGPRGIATQSSDHGAGQFPASLGIDGNLENFTHTAAGQNLPSTWEVDLRDEYLISAIVLYNRRGCCLSRLRDLTVQILDAPDGDVLFESDLLNEENILSGGGAGGPDSLMVDLVELLGDLVAGSIVRVVRTPDPDLSGTGGVGNADEADVLSLAEVEIFSPTEGLPPPPPPPPPLEPIEEGVNPIGWIRSNAWNMLFLDQDGGCGGGGAGRMIGNWVAPYEMEEEEPRPGDEWDIDFIEAEARGWTGANVSDIPTWISMNFLRANAIDLIPEDLVNFDIYAQRARFNSTDNIVAIATTYVENTTGDPMRVEVCTASDDSVRIDVNNVNVTLVSVCRGSAADCQETRCAELAPGVNKITAYVWEGGGGWNLRLGLRDQNGQVLSDASEDVVFLGTGADDELEGQFIEEPPEDCFEAGPPPPPDDEGFENVGPNGIAIQSSEGWGGNPQRGIDGNTDGQWGGGSVTHTNGEPSWWEVDLMDTYYISYMRIWNRLDCCSERLTNFTITVLDFEREVVWEETFLPGGGQINGPFLTIEDVEAEGQFVRVEMPGPYLSIAELEILQPTDAPPPSPDEVCGNGIDDDEDGDADCDDADCSEEESCQEPAGPSFVRGDADDNGIVNLTDAIFNLNYLFIGGVEPGCLDSADADNNNTLQLTDGIFILNFLFNGGVAPPAPGIECGEDPDAGKGQGCEIYNSCN